MVRGFRRNEKAYGGSCRSESPPGRANRDRRDRLLAIGEIAAEVAHEPQECAPDRRRTSTRATEPDRSRAPPRQDRAKHADRTGIVDDLMVRRSTPSRYRWWTPPLGREGSPDRRSRTRAEPATRKAWAHAGLVPSPVPRSYENAIKAKAPGYDDRTRGWSGRRSRSAMTVRVPEPIQISVRKAARQRARSE